MHPPQASDAKLLTVLDQTMETAVAHSGSWLACRPGCTPCCVGVFAISALDAERLREGLTSLAASAPERAQAVLERAASARERLAVNFPGHPETGLLATDDEDFDERFGDYANDEVCPVLDPATGLCELYAARPVTCRSFGPPVYSEDGIAVCELCFVGAEPEVVEQAAVSLTAATELEEQLTPAAEQRTGLHGQTLIAFALSQ